MMNILAQLADFGKNVYYLVAVTSLSFISSASVLAQKPNIVFIMADDLGWADVGYHRPSEISTPFIDSLASEGLKLERFYAHPTCTPSRSAIMTGMLPLRNGFQDKNILPADTKGLPLNRQVLPEALKQLGYKTSLIGKWHLGNNPKEYLPQYRGFDEQYGIYSGSGEYFTHTNMLGYDFFRNGERICQEGYVTDLYTDEAIQKLNMYSQQDSPFFLYLSYTAPHTPLQAKKEDLELFSHIENASRRKYLAMVYRLDQSIGRVTKAIESLGLSENTLIIFMSDNGGDLTKGAKNTPLQSGKASVYEGGIRVPAFMRWKGKIAPKSTISNTMQAIDIYPTLVKLAGGDITGLPIDGLDFMPLIMGEINSLRKNTVLALGTKRAAACQGPLKLMTMSWAEMKNAYLNNGDWKSKGYLFNVQQDISEQNNLINEQEDVAASLMETLLNMEKNAIPPFAHSPNVTSVGSTLLPCEDYLDINPCISDITIGDRFCFRVNTSQYLDSISFRVKVGGQQIAHTNMPIDNIYSVSHGFCLAMPPELREMAKQNFEIVAYTENDSISFVKTTAYTTVCSNSQHQSNDGFDIKIYPNPINSQFTLDLNFYISSGILEVYDITGRLAYTIPLNNTKLIHINQISLTAGYYTVVVHDFATKYQKYIRVIKK